MKYIQINLKRFMEYDTIDVEIVNATKNKTDNFRNLIKSLTTLDSRLSNVTKTVGRLSDSLDRNREANKKNNNEAKKGASVWALYSKNVVSNLVKFRIISGAVSGVATEFTNLYEKAAEYEESLNLYTVSLGEYAEEGRKWAEKISNALYLDPTNILQYAGALKSLTEGLGVASKDANLMSTNITQLAYDMSSYLNIDVQSAYDKLQSGLSGQVRGLRQVGIAVTNASLQELAYQLNIKKSITNMTEREKVYLRYIQIMRQSTNMQGDLARTLMTPENALRMVKTQFQQLSRAIGQVFIPITLKAIPYVMALTNMLTALANRLSSMLGYKLADIDYSSLTKMDNTVQDIGDSASSSTKKLKGMLAPFDELNVVQSKSTSGGGGVGADTIDFSKYLTGYDMLQGLNDKFKTQVASAEKQLKALAGVIGIVAAAWKVNKMLNFMTKLSVLKDKALKAGISLTTLKASFSTLLPHVTRLGTALGTFVSFKVAKSALYDLMTGAKQADEALGPFIATVGTAAGLAALFTGSAWGALPVLLGTLAGELVGISDAYVEARNEIIKADLFDDVGTSFEKIQAQYDTAFSSIMNYNNQQTTLRDELEQSKTKLLEVRDALTETLRAAAEGDYETPKEEAAAIKKAYDNWAIAANDVATKENNLYTSTIEYLRGTGQISEEEYTKRKKNAEELLELELAQNKGYASSLAELQLKLKNGIITQDEYNTALDELHNKYVLADGSLSDLKSTTLGYATLTEKGINLKDYDDLTNKVGDLKTYFTNLSTTTTNTYNKRKGELQDEIKKYSLIVAAMEGAGDTASDTYITTKNHLDDLNNTLSDTETQYSTDMASINGTYKDTLLTIYGQLQESGAAATYEFKGVTNTITGELDNLKNYDTSTSVAGLFNKLTSTWQSEGTKFNNGQITEFQKYGANWGDTMVSSLLETGSKKLNDRKGSLNQASKNIGVEAGNNAGLGYAQGIYSGDVNSAIKKSVGYGGKGTSNTGLIGNTFTCIQNAQDSHSPSKLFETLGVDGGLGYGNGLSTNEVISNAKTSANRLIKSVEDSFKETSLKVNVDTNIDSSLNTLLGKVQKFCNSWQNAINELAKNMKNTMNGIKIDSAGKVSYTKMPKINVERFDGGGMPTSGDLFFANENGRAEWISSVGNKTAVANQDQMATIVTNAVIAGFNKLRPMTQEPSTTNVYIGNEKVYSGQGEYQNRQSDRYGTTRTIKV